MKKEELDAFEKKFGYQPTAVKVSIDALAVFVHKDNPIKGLSMQQVDSIFSSSFTAGGKDVASWDQVGLAPWAGKAISLNGRNSASGTYCYFKEVALKKGDFKSTVKEQPGSSAVVQGISADQYGIGYSGIGYVTSSVRALPLSAKPKGKQIAATYENCLSGDYPLARFLLIYVNKKPGEPLPATALEFLKYVLSVEGQTIVEKDGYYPLPAEVAAEMVESISK